MPRAKQQNAVAAPGAEVPASGEVAARTDAAVNQAANGKGRRHAPAAAKKAVATKAGTAPDDHGRPSARQAKAQVQAPPAPASPAKAQANRTAGPSQAVAGGPKAEAQPAAVSPAKVQAHGRAVSPAPAEKAEPQPVPAARAKAQARRGSAGQPKAEAHGEEAGPAKAEAHGEEAGPPKAEAHGEDAGPPTTEAGTPTIEAPRHSRPARSPKPAKADKPAGQPEVAEAVDDEAQRLFFEHQKELLIAERSNYTRQAEELKAEAEALALEHEPGDVQFDEEGGEGGTANVDRELDLHLSAQAHAAVEEIDAAMEKIALGTYGFCESCDTPIPQARLEALPHARLCVSCKSGGLTARRQ